MELVVTPVDPSRWDDLAELFGPNGTYRGCWCMNWRLTNQESTANGNAGNRAAMERLVKSGEPVGLLGYHEGRPVAWCSISPRPAFTKIMRSTVLGPSDPEDATIWSVPCFFIKRGYRRQGLAEVMLRHAIEHARAVGAPVLEAYGADTEGGQRPAATYTGTVEMFQRAGFTEHARVPTGRRVVMRLDLQPAQAKPKKARRS